MHLSSTLVLLATALFPTVQSSQLRMGIPNPATDVSEQDQFVAQSGIPSLFDLLTIQTRSSIFGDYLRSADGLSELLQTITANCTLFVPTNKAVLALARKP